MTVEAFAGDVERFGSVKRYARRSSDSVPELTKQTGMSGEKPRQALTKGGQNLLKKYMFLAAETARRHDPELLQPPTSVRSRAASTPLPVRSSSLRTSSCVASTRSSKHAQPASLLAIKYAGPTALSSMRPRLGRTSPNTFRARRLKKREKRAPQTVGPTGTVSQTGSSEDATKAVEGCDAHIFATKHRSHTKDLPDEAQLTKTCLTGLRRYRARWRSAPARNRRGEARRHRER